MSFIISSEFDNQVEASADSMQVERQQMNQKHSLQDLNKFGQQEFVRVVGPVFEHSPWIAEAASAQRPFTGLNALHQTLCETVRKAGEERQLDLICAHPDLVGRVALAGALTTASTSEQSSAGLNKLSPEEVALFQKCNQAYRDKFGFPFVICARLNKKAAILAAFPVRLGHSRDEEIRTALEEIFKIAELRLQDLVG
jgi:OHCU decarboxylase